LVLLEKIARFKLGPSDAAFALWDGVNILTTMGPAL
jgi:hypothetical protein